MTSQKTPSGELIGKEFQRQRHLPSRLHTYLTPVLMGIFIAGLLMSVLRMQITTLRYQLSDAHQTEKSLRTQMRNLIVQQRTLLDPARLTERAKELGFAPPERIIQLSPPVPAEQP